MGEGVYLLGGLVVLFRGVVFFCGAFIQLDKVTLDLDELAYKMEQVFFQYGVRRVLRAHHDETLPLYELHFTSEHTLEMFLKEKQEADLRIKNIIMTSLGVRVLWNKSTTIIMQVLVTVEATFLWRFDFVWYQRSS